MRKTSVFSRLEYSVTAALIVAGSLLTFLFGAWWFRLSHVPHNFSGVFHLFDFVLFGVISYVVWYQLVNEILSWDLALSMKRPCPMLPRAGFRVALLTAFVPGKEPYDMLEKTLAAMKRVAYPHDTWVLDEGDDAKVKQLCERYDVLHYTRKGIPEFNRESGKFRARTKSGNYNSWFAVHSSRYDIVAQHDVDFVPSPTYLMKTLGYFNDPAIAFVGTPQIYGNTDESWIARGAAEQAYGFFGPLQKGLFGHDMQLFIGANHVIRVAAHEDITGYAGHIVEDHLTGMRLYHRRWKSVYVPEILLVGEGPATWDAYFSQQMRWAFGLIDILFRHSPRLFPRMRPRHALRYFFLQQYYFFGVVQVLGVVAVALFFWLGIETSVMDLNTVLIFYPLLLILHLIIFLWLQRFYIDPKKESGFHVAGKMLNLAVWPIYFLALIGAVFGKKLSYQVTPKGVAQRDVAMPPLASFWMHFVLGTVSGVSLLVGILSERTAPLLVFWSVLNTLFMYGFVLFAIFERGFTKRIDLFGGFVVFFRSVAFLKRKLLRRT